MKINLKITKKKMILVIIILVIFIAAMLLAFGFTKNEKIAPPQSYGMGGEVVDSITSVVGERDLKEVKVEEGKEEDTTTEYVYTGSKNAEEDANAYIAHLVEAYDYTPLKGAESQEGKKIEKKSVKEEVERQSEHKKGNAQKELSAAKELEEEGKLLEVTVSYGEEDEYIVIVQEYIGELPKPEKETEESKAMSQQDAISMLQGYTPQQLGLSKEVENYELIPNRGRALINGTEFFNINVYEQRERSNVIQGVFYVACDGSVMYRYDIATDQYTMVE